MDRPYRQFLSRRNIPDFDVAIGTGAAEPIRVLRIEGNAIHTVGVSDQGME